MADHARVFQNPRDFRDSSGRERSELPDGVATSRLQPDTNYHVSSGQTISGFVVKSGNVQDVEAHGKTISSRVSSGGVQIVELGGIATDTQVFSGGVQDVRGVARGTVLEGLVTGPITSALQKVFSGGEAIGTIVGTADLEIVSGGGLAIDTQVVDGSIRVDSGGVISAAKVSSLGDIDIDAGGTGDGVIVDPDSELFVDGAATNVIVNGALGEIGSGGSIDGATLIGSGVLDVFSGTSSNIVISKGGFELVGDYGSASVSGAIISSGGNLEIASGGVGTAITILSGGVLMVSGGSVAGVTVESGGMEEFAVVESGQRLSNVLISGYSQDVLSGGATVSARVEGDYTGQILDGGVTTGTIVGAGGFEWVKSGSVATATVVSARGDLILSGGIETGAIILGGGVNDMSGGTASGTILKSGQQNVSSGVAFDTVVSRGGYIDVEGGVTSGAVILSGGGEGVGFNEGGGDAEGTIVHSGGVLAVYDGSASGAVVLAGGEIAFGGGAITDLAMRSGALLAGSASLSPGQALKDVTLIDDVENAGGYYTSVTVGSGAKTIGVIVSGSATEIVSSGGMALDAIVESGGAIVLAGGAASDTIIRSGGIEAVAAGVTLSSPAISAGTTLIVSSGGFVSGTVSFGSASDLVIDAPSGLESPLAGFAAGDTLDLAAFRFGKGDKLSFVENPAKTSGVLTIKSGTTSLDVTLFGQYVAAGFHISSDGAGGTAISYTPQTSATLDLAAKH